MKINEHNYEAFLLDMIEGRLDRKDEVLLKQFILQNPELGTWEELTSTLPVLAAESYTFPDKHALRKPEAHSTKGMDESNYEEQFISFHEGLLSKQEQDELDNFLKENTKLRKEFTLFGKVYLKPDLSILFVEKEKLYQKIIFLSPVFVRNISVAASLLLLFSIGWWWLRSSQVDHKVIIPVEIPVQVPEETKQSAVFENITPQISEASEIKAKKMESYDYSEAKTQSSPTEVGERLESLPSMSGFTASKIEQPIEEKELSVTIPVSNRIILASLVSGSNIEEQEKSKSVFGRIIDNSIGKTLAAFKPSKDELDDITETTPLSKGFSLWDLASSGVKTYNALTDSDAQLVQAHDKNGNLLGVRFNSDRINFSKNFSASTEN